MTLYAVKTGSLAVTAASTKSLWLVNPAKSELDAVFNNGPTAEKVLTYSQRLDRGLISMVYSTGQPFCENNIGEHPEHDR